MASSSKGEAMPIPPLPPKHECWIGSLEFGSKLAGSHPALEMRATQGINSPNQATPRGEPASSGFIRPGARHLTQPLGPQLKTPSLGSNLDRKLRQMISENDACNASSAAERMRISRQRRRDGLRCVMIELRETEISELVRRGYLSEDGRNDPNAIRTALYWFLDYQLSLP
jgi:hypothetical protein